MSPTDPRLKAALDAALNRVRNTASAVAQRVSDTLGTMSLAAGRIAERDQMLSAQSDLRRNMAAFQVEFRSVLLEKLEREQSPRDEGRRRPAATDWQSMSLVDDHEVEERMHSDRIGQMISHECEWELRELAAYMGTVMRTGRADDERNPLRGEVLGAALYRAIEAVSDQADIRKLLAREIGQTMARAMRTCYAEILNDLKARGVQPVGLSVRTMDGPGHHLPGINSAYQTLPKSEYHSTRSQSGDLDTPITSHPDGLRSTGGSSLSSMRGAGQGAATGGRSYAGTGQGRGDSAALRADAQLMNLLRRLSALASRPGDFDGRPRQTGEPGSTPLHGAGSSAHAGERHGGLAAQFPGRGHGEALSGLMAVNLIRAHREELLQASTGKLDHMVIDVIGSLFDQILSDPRVPPQMARQIARLQLPVLRVALNDASFFSSRRHPVRRFVNRIASLACAFDDFDEGPGKLFLTRVRDLVQEIVEGDFDQVGLYTDKLAELEGFIAKQTHDEVEQAGTAVTLDGKESELLVQQRYLLQLRAALAPLPLPDYLGDFLTQVWSQALVLSSRRDGVASERFARFRRAGRDLVMSVQPKGNPTLRQRFLMQLPGLMKDLNEGMRLIGWPEAAQKAFFGKLLPAHAESLKLPALSELDHNLMAKQLEGIFNAPIPGQEALSAAERVADVDETVIEQRFTPQEAQQVGLVEHTAVDWSGGVDIDLADDDAATEPDADTTSPLPLDIGLDIDLGTSEPQEPSRGPQLMDHIKLGFAYQMQLKDEWQKVRLTYVSPARSFFVFTHGKKHQETISMTARMLARMCETGRMRAVESAYLMERATQRARKQLAALKAVPTRQ